MKKFITTLVLVAGFISVFASDPKPVPFAVANAFETTYPRAENVKWETAGNFFVSNFTIDDHRYWAYFHTDGSLAVVAEIISIGQLPKSLRHSLAERLKELSLLSVYRMESQDGLKYYCELMSGKNRVILESGGLKWQAAVK